MPKLAFAAALALLGGALVAGPVSAQQTQPNPPPAFPEVVSLEMAPAESGYAEVNGLRMYFEVYGEGAPLLLLHGAYMSIPSAWAAYIPRLAESRQVIAVELQGHARTADVDRPITYEGMADDVAAFLESRSLTGVDVIGYSMGAATALQLAIRHPELVRRLVPISASASADGLQPGFAEMLAALPPEAMVGTPMEAEYKAYAPNPDDFLTLVEKLTALDLAPQDWDISVIAAATLLMFGDSDVVTVEHATEMYRALGGGSFGDIAGMPNSRLAILPGKSHITVLDEPDVVLAMILPFLDADLAVDQPR